MPSTAKSGWTGTANKCPRRRPRNTFATMELKSHERRLAHEAYRRPVLRLCDDLHPLWRLHHHPRRHHLLGTRRVLSRQCRRHDSPPEYHRVRRCRTHRLVLDRPALATAKGERRQDALVKCLTGLAVAYIAAHIAGERIQAYLKKD